MRTPLPLTRDLVLVGGGHAHALVLKRWGMRPLPGVRVTLIDPNPATAYTGMLPGFVAGHYARETLEIDLVRLARFAGVRIILGQADGLDPAARAISVKGQAPIRFDIASLDVGATGRIPDIEGFADHVATAKPLSGFADAWTAYLDRLKAGQAGSRLAVIGAGAAGIELALAAQHRLSARGEKPSITLIEARDRIAPELSPAARAQLKRRLARGGIALELSADITRLSAGGVALASGTVLPADFIIGAAGVMAWPWLQDTPLETQDGYVAVDAQLRSLSHTHIFAAGDCAHLTTSPRVKAGVFAVRAAPVLERNLRAALQGQTPVARFKPQHDYLKLISTGTKSAVAEKYGLAFSARWLWRLKDRIDQAFMRKLGALTPMSGAAPEGPVAAGVAALVGEGQPLCGGCGSKTGRDALSSGLAGLTAPQRADVLTGPGDDAAVLKSGDGVQVITTDHLRTFSQDPHRFAEITAVHCLGDVWACGARPQAALATLILPPMSDALQASVIAEIMEAAGAVFRRAGADIVGGHTTTGAEMSLGFTVTGLANKAVTQRGARPGDVLVLTKPIGTGVILAGDMALRARGRDVAACWDFMARAQQAAADMLAPIAHAMTDVTGFGLAGHLRALLGKDLSAQLSLDDIPTLPGAVALAQGGVRSSLFNANQLPAETFKAPAGARRDLLLDPQTAGGLLAAIPQAACEPVFQAFAEANEPIWRVGQVTAPGPESAIIQAV